MNDEYRALVHKVATFCETLSDRLREHMACGPGCSSCCHAWLSLSAVEAAELTRAIAALPEPERQALAQRGRHELEREQRGEPDPRCALLDDDGRCAVYAHRPLVCRTQGLALRYPRDVIPVSALRARLVDGDVTSCPLNFTQGIPTAQDVLDAERVDQLLGLVNMRYCAASGDDPSARRAISAIAAAACD